jgi:uncharacterized membrane protein
MVLDILILSWKLCAMWNYVQNGQACGPVATAALQSLLQNGTLGPDTLVWKQGMPNWVPARSVGELGGQFGQAGPAASGPAGSLPPPVPPMGYPPIPGASADPDKADAEQNKVFAVLGYIGILFLVPLLAAPNSKFARYHANQGLILFLSLIVLWVCVVVLTFIPFLGILMIPIHFLLPLAGLAMMIIGIINAANGQCKPLPVIGGFTLLK